MNSRLQFVHYSGGTFNTREDAVNYVKKIQSIDRPALLAEPMIMLYKNEEDNTDPHVILAIGTVGDGVTYSNDNRTFFIDTHKTEGEIASIEEEIEAVVKALTLYEKDSNTLDLTVERTPDGTTISGDVRLSDYEIYKNPSNGNKVQRDNILQATEKGLFAFVDLKYDSDKNEFTFFLNDRIEKFQLPTETYVVSGEYDIKTEEIKLYYNTDYKKEKPVVIDVNNLIEEWKTEEEDSDTPIVLVRERIKNEEDGHKFQDVLKGDVRVAKTPLNILEKTEDGKGLLVKGTADNIHYKGDTVEANLDKLNKEVVVSADDNNIVIRREDGLYASVDLKYDSTTNTLQFKNTKTNGYRDIKLNGVDIFTAIWYDQATEELNLQWKDSNGDLQVVKIKVSDMFDEWEVENDEHSIKLEKTRSTAGKTLLVGDVKISQRENNILQDLNHELYVNGISENIKYGEKSTVREQLDTLNTKMDEKDEQVGVLSGAIDSVTATAEENKKNLADEANTRKEETAFLSGAVDTNKDAIKVINDTIGTGLFEPDEHTNITAKFKAEVKAREDADTKLTEDLKKVSDDLAGEVETREKEVEALTTQTKNNTDKIGSGFTTDVHDNITFKFKKEQTERKEADAKLEKALNELSGKSINFVENTESIEMVKSGDSIKSNVKISSKDSNVIEIVTDNDHEGIFASVDVKYDSQTNVLTLVTNKGSKPIQLVGVTAFDEIKYNPVTETIDIKVTGKDEIVSIPVGAIIREWEVDNKPESVIELTLGDHVKDGKDKLSASAKISTKEDNILENNGGALYVSNSAITANAESIGRIDNTIGTGFTSDEHLNVTAKFGELSGKVEELSAKTINDVVDTDSVDLTKTNDVFKADVKISGKEGNIIEIVKDNAGDGLFASVKLAYDDSSNILTLQTNKGDQPIQLVGVTDFKSIQYNAKTETIDIVARGVEEPIHIPVGAIIQEWVVNNDEASPIVLTLSNHVVDGKDVLSANVKVSTKEDNILEAKDGALYVSNKDITKNASNIETINKTIGEGFSTDAHETIGAKFKTEVKAREDADTKLTGDLKAVSDKLDAEVQTRGNETIFLSGAVNTNKDAIETINNTIGKDFSTDEHKTVSYLFGQETEARVAEDKKLADAIQALSDSSDSKIDEVDGKVGALNTRVTDNEKNIKNINNLIGNGFTPDENNLVNITGKFNKEVENRENADKNILNKVDELSGKSIVEVDETKTLKITKDGNKISGNVKLSTDSTNLIQVKDGGLFTNVTVSYDENSNELVTTTNGVETRKRLNGIVKFQDSYYNPDTENLIIEYFDNKNEKQHIEVDLSKLADEFVVNNADESAVVLKLSERTKKSPEKLSADVKIASTDVHPDNILVKDGGALYVSNSGITKNASAIESINKTIGNGFSSVAGQTIADKVKANAEAIATNGKAIETLDGRCDQFDRDFTAQAGTLTEHGTKIGTLTDKCDELASSVDEIGDRVESLENASSSSTGAIEALGTKLDTEIERSKEADLKLKNSVDTFSGEVNTYKTSNDKVVNEVKASVVTEKERAEKAEGQLDSKISGVTNSLATTIATLTSTSGDVVDLKTDVGNLNTRLTSVDDHYKKEVSKLVDVDSGLNTKIDNETVRANGVESEIKQSVLDEASRAMVAETGIMSVVNNAITKLEASDTTLSTKLGETTEVATKNTSAIAQEVDDRKKAVEALGEAMTKAVDGVKVSVEDTQTIDLSIDDKNKIKGNVIIANGDNNILIASQNDNNGAGLFASVNLEYNAATNTLVFTTTGKEAKNIKLNAGSIINGIDYDSSSKELVVRYKPTDSDKESETRVDVGDLINDWNVKPQDEDGNYSGAIALVKTRKEDGSYELSGRVQVSTLPSNILVNDNGNLYVDGTSITKASSDIKDLSDKLNQEILDRQGADNTISGKVDTNTEEIDKLKLRIGTGFTGVDGDSITNKFVTVEKNVSENTTKIENFAKTISGSTELVKKVISSVNLNDDGTFKKELLTGTNYISGATNVMECLRFLDQAIKEFNDKLMDALKGSDTYSVGLSNNNERGETDSKLYGRVRLAKAKGQTEDIENIKLSDQDIIDGTDLHNLLKIVHQDGSMEGNSTNGLYYDGSVDYGAFDNDGNIDY